MTNALDKVAVFAVRSTSGQPVQLLVFRHPTAGLQVPAGTVEPGEPPEAAVIRELREETGIDAVLEVRRLKVVAEPLADGEQVITERCDVYSAPRGAGALVGTFNRGWRVVVHHEEGEWAQASFREYDVSVTPWAVLRSTTGWLPKKVLAPQILRHFYCARVPHDGRDSWSIASDLGNTFKCFWALFVPHPDLVRGQDEWLKSIYPNLRVEIDRWANDEG